MNLTVIKLQTLGYDPRNGLDIYFYAKAVDSKKKIFGLEKFQEQLDLLDALSSVNQDELVFQTLKDLDIIEKEYDTILDAWSNGDLKVLEDTILKSFEGYPELFETIITGRNKKWTEMIELSLKKRDNYIFVVGVAHMAGKEGILELLMDKGYHIEQM